LGTRLQSNDGSGHRSHGGQGGTTAGLQLFCVGLGFTVLYASKSGLVPNPVFDPFVSEPDPFVSDPLALDPESFILESEEYFTAPGGFDGGTAFVFNIYKSSDPGGTFELDDLYVSANLYVSNTPGWP
jgi:hypothetical protein